MTTPPFRGHFKLESGPDLSPLREALEQAGFTVPALAATMAIDNPAESLDIPLVLLRTAEPTAYNTFTRLFILEQIVPEKTAREAFGSMPLETLFDCNLLRRVEGGAQATVKLAPFDGSFFASDFPYPYKGGTFPSDYVVGVGAASVSLVNLTVRKQVASVLDVGTGAGVQSILAAPHAGKVVGTDTNPRALNFAAFNARLNGVGNVEWREGSFFEPAHEAFDLVVANPPFVISPESSLLYRDGHGKGDSVSEHVARESARHLNEGGFSAMLVNWHHESDDDWPARPIQWFEGNGCDNWLLRFQEQDPTLYAARWLRQTSGQQSQVYSRQLAEWIEYYEKAGIKRISSGAILQRKRGSGRNWIRCDSFQDARASGPCGEHILRIFAAEDFLRSLPDDQALLDCKFSVQPGLRVDQKVAWRNGQWTGRELLMSLDVGLPFPGHADRQLIRLLGGCDGQRTLRECIDLVALEFNTPASSLTPSSIPVIKKLLAAGALTT